MPIPAVAALDIGAYNPIDLFGSWLAAESHELSTFFKKLFATPGSRFDITVVLTDTESSFNPYTLHKVTAAEVAAFDAAAGRGTWGESFKYRCAILQGLEQTDLATYASTGVPLVTGADSTTWDSGLVLEINLWTIYKNWSEKYESWNTSTNKPVHYYAVEDLMANLASMSTSDLLASDSANGFPLARFMMSQSSRLFLSDTEIARILAIQADKLFVPDAAPVIP